VDLDWISLLHPVSGLIVVGLAAVVATYGWRYRNARLGKSGLDVIATFNLQRVHKYLGISLLSLTIIVWLLEEFAFRLNTVVTITHSINAIALIVLLAISATIILRFRRRLWAMPIHLTLNGLIVVLLIVQLLSGLGLINYLHSLGTNIY